MKKTLLSVLAGVAVITSASAGIKETCLQNPDKLVWLEKDNTCIPVHPCENEKYSAYCNRIFENYYIQDLVMASSYAELLLCNKYKYCDTADHSIKEADNGVTYLSYKMKNGGYMDFIFARKFAPYDKTNQDLYSRQKQDHVMAVFYAYALDDAKCENDVKSAGYGKYICHGLSETRCNTIDSGPFISTKYSSGLCNIDIPEE